MYAYVTLKDNIAEPVDQIIGELKALVKKQIGGFAAPEMVQVSIQYITVIDLKPCSPLNGNMLYNYPGLLF